MAKYSGSNTLVDLIPCCQIQSTQTLLSIYFLSVAKILDLDLSDQHCSSTAFSFSPAAQCTDDCLAVRVAALLSADIGSVHVCIAE